MNKTLTISLCLLLGFLIGNSISGEKIVNKKDIQRSVQKQQATIIKPEKFSQTRLYTLLLAATLATQRGMHHIALDYYALLTKLTKHPDIAQQTIKLAIHTKQSHKALPALKIWQQVEPNHPIRDYLASLLYINLNDKNNVSKHLLALGQQVKNNPNNAYYQARQQYNKLIGIPNYENLALLNLAKIAIQQNDFSQARIHLQTIITKEPQNTLDKFYMGRLYDFQKKYPEAIYWYQQVTHGSAAFNAQVRSVILMIQMRESKKALKVLEKIPARTNDQAKIVLITHAEILLQQQLPQKAYRLINDEVDPNNPDIDLLYARAMIAENLACWRIMEKDLRFILQHKPNHANVLNALAFALANQESRSKEALPYVKQALKIEPNNPNFMDTMGWVHYRMGNYDLAIKFLTQAYSINGDPDIASHLGEVLWNQGDKQNAKAIWQKALKQAPHNQRLQKMIKRYMPPQQ